MKKEYPREIVEEGREIERLLVKECDIVRGKGKAITKEDAQRKITEFVVELFREGRISQEVYDYLLLGMGINETSLALILVDAREMFDKRMNWKEFQNFSGTERMKGIRLL